MTDPDAAVGQLLAELATTNTRLDALEREVRSMRRESRQDMSALDTAMRELFAADREHSQSINSLARSGGARAGGGVAVLVSAVMQLLGAVVR